MGDATTGEKVEDDEIQQEEGEFDTQDDLLPFLAQGQKMLGSFSSQTKEIVKTSRHSHGFITSNCLRAFKTHKGCAKSLSLSANSKSEVHRSNICSLSGR